MINKGVRLKLVIAPDKFKGTLSAAAAAVAMARGWRNARPEDRIELLPISDGGDGFGPVLSDLLGARPQTVPTVDAAHRACKATWWWEPKSKTAVIESANVIGLAMLPAKVFHPFDLDTFGLGAVVRAASAKGARRCIIGIGGSATNDGGFGLARSLGWRFLDRNGAEIERWTNLSALNRIVAPAKTRWFKELIVALDVQNRLLGVRGATRVYGLQKGLKPSQLADAEKNLRQLVRVSERLGFGSEVARRPGTGAAGGLGFGLMTFLRARPEAGFDLFADYAELNRKLRSADLVITGEGRIDASTFMGKAVGQILQLCRKLHIPCLLIAGSIDSTRRFQHAFALTKLTTVANARNKPAHWLQRLAAQAAVSW